MNFIYLEKHKSTKTYIFYFLGGIPQLKDNSK